MGVIFDLVQIVGPVADCSYPPNSRLLVDFFDSEQKANAQCETFNRCCLIDGVGYEVEAHDEESPKRAQWDEGHG